MVLLILHMLSGGIDFDWKAIDGKILQIWKT